MNIQHCNGQTVFNKFNYHVCLSSKASHKSSLNDLQCLYTFLWAERFMISVFASCHYSHHLNTPFLLFSSLCCLMVIYHIKVFTYENIALFIKRLFMTAASAIERFNFVAPRKKQEVFFVSLYTKLKHTLHLL